MSLEFDIGQKKVALFDDVANTIVFPTKDSLIVNSGKQDGLIVASIAGLGAASTSQAIIVVQDVYIVNSVSAIYTVAGGAAAAVTVSVDTGVQAPGAGTAQLTAVIPLTGVANTTLAGTLIAAPTSTAAGNRISLLFSGTLTGLANLCVTVTLKRQ